MDKTITAIINIDGKQVEVEIDLTLHIHYYMYEIEDIEVEITNAHNISELK